MTPTFADQRQLQSALSGDTFLARFISACDLKERWGIADSTLRRLDKEKTLAPVTLPGKGDQKFYRVVDVSAIEENLVAGSGPRANPIAEARRRNSVLEAFESIVDADDLFRQILEKIVTDRVDADAAFTAENVDSFITGERQKLDAVAQMIRAEQHDSMMKSFVGPTAAERAASTAAEITPAAPLSRGHFTDGLVLETEEIDPFADTEVTPFEFGGGK